MLDLFDYTVGFSQLQARIHRIRDRGVPVVRKKRPVCTDTNYVVVK
jgi:hypothetical protein